MSQRQKHKQSYKEASESPILMELEDDQNCPTIVLSKPQITYLGSLYESGRETIYEDEYGFGLYQVNQFDILLEDNAKTPRIVGILDTMDGLTADNAIVTKQRCPFEFYISTLKTPSILKKALNIGWFSNDEVIKYRVPRSFRLKYKKGRILWYSNITYKCRCDGKCKCSLIPRFFKVRIVKSVRPMFMGELMPPYYCYVFINHSAIGKYLWAHEISLYEEKPHPNHPFEEIEDICYSWVMHCPKYLNLCMLGASNIPRYVDIQSCYYNHKSLYFADIGKITLASSYNTLFEDEYKMEINFLLDKTFTQTVKPKRSSKTIKIRGTKLNLMKYGIPASPYKFDYKLKQYLLSTQAIFTFTKKFIQVTLNTDTIKNIRDKGIVIVEKILDEDDKEEINLEGDIILKYNRDKFTLYVASFTFESDNRHIVVNDENETEEKIDEEDILQNIGDNDIY